MSRIRILTTFVSKINRYDEYRPLTGDDEDMNNEATHYEHLLNLMNGTPFEEISEHYPSESKCFSKLRDEAKRSLTSVDEYLEFYKTCHAGGPTNTVESYIERNGVRMLKNMIIRGSRAGKRYYIKTASELQKRTEQLNDIAGENITLRSVVATTIEHILGSEDQGKNRLYETADRLLRDVPEDPNAGIGLLARVRFVVAAESLDKDSPAFNIHITDLSEAVPDFYPDDKRGASELLEAGEDAPWHQERKLKLYSSGIARSSSPSMETLQKYLYYTARDVPERYRHSGRSTPFRGELQAALIQFNCYLNTFEQDINKERMLRAQSYRSVVHGELKSGRQWRTQRDPNLRPDPNFLSASGSFLTAAESISSVDMDRYIKYLSKSFRNFALGVRQPSREFGPAQGWKLCRECHQAAISSFIRIRESINNEETIEVIDETIALHSFYSFQASAVIAFEYGNPNQLAESIDQAFNQIDRAPVYLRTDLLQGLRNAEQGLRCEQDGSYEDAINHYEKITEPEVDIQKRRELTEIKHYIQEEEEERAIDLAEKKFDNSPVLTAVQKLADRKPDGVGIKPPVLDDLRGVDSNTKWRFTVLAYLVGDTYGDFETMEAELKTKLLDL
jgi:tetratricopeptide (TPR) repeat protein